MKTKYWFEDFTEKSYQELLKLGKSSYEFITYSDYERFNRKILWRHDVDFSLHRALALAKIERKEEVNSTYFLHLHSIHYNLLEEELTEIINEIIALDHEIGLHYDPYYYEQVCHAKADQLQFIKIEKEYLEQLFDTPINAISIHQPETNSTLDLTVEKIGDMVNAYSNFIMENYSYCSDSNGYWRFRRLYDVLNEGEDNALQILTHPVWWTPEVMSPRNRVSRCIDGRRDKQTLIYDQLMETLGRDNIQ